MNFRSGSVTAITAERRGLQKVEVDGEPAYVLTQLTGPVSTGDRVVINTTAVDLGLGTGGWHFVHWNLSRTEWRAPGGGHVLKLRYTSLQVDSGAAEEGPGAATLPADLGGVPVVACSLHSQVGCVAGAFAGGAPGRRLVYVMTDTAALPLCISDLVAGLQQAGLLASTVTCGQAFGGDYEAVGLHSALQVAVGVAGADAVVVGPGPGVVGTATSLGHSGAAVSAVLDAASLMGATPILAVRFSGADPRARHSGVSHHTTTVLGLAARPLVVAVPAGETAPGLPPDLVRAVEVPDVAAVLRARGIEITTMGRTEADDPAFYRYSGAAGALAAALVGPSAARVSAERPSG